MSDIPSGPAVHVSRPFRQFIVKLHSRCNLACDYCYVYNGVDQRWRDRPVVMSDAVAEQFVHRVAEHVARHALTEIEVVLHGGEPLLAGPDAVRRLLTGLRAAVPATVRAAVQTNATLLDADFLELFRELDVRIGVSLDGDAIANERHRVRRNGDGAYPDIRAGLLRLTDKPFRSLFAGLLCTVDLRNDPVDTYEALLEFTPPRVDFLLPHGNWTSWPPDLPTGTGESPYGAWLVAVFDRWYSAPRRETGVRMFEEIVNVLLGGHSAVEGVGLAPASMVLVETDGLIETADYLTATFSGAGATGLHIARDSFDEVLHIPDVRARQVGVDGLCATCRDCELREACGGGLRAHRYRADTDGAGAFDNPSVYCTDLYRLINHIRSRLSTDLAALRRATT
jgi:uncharacterized protein